ncbi:MAG TPA: APC family permease [Actinomycetota bacterium]|jgi:amino acid transporter|nr:APC family permease [Actinomycetota bacterium]
MAATSTGSASKGTSLLKRLLVGRAVSSARLEHTLLPKVLALPVFASDALSSVAYATEEILAVLLVASAGAYDLVMPIAIAIGALMLVVVTSYRQTVHAYPMGGGAYMVSKENLGLYPGLVAAAALLTDYVLTVAVSIVAGVLAMTSAAPGLLPFRVEIAVGFITLITLANLRGVRESGILFAVPTYAFIGCILVMIGVGLARCIGGCPLAEPVLMRPGLATAAGTIGLFTVLRAFASGATALTGVEAIADGVPAFRRPQAKNAAETLAILGVMGVTMFIGISFLSSRMHLTVSEERTVVAQIAHGVFGGGPGFYAIQIFTTAILVLAANTSFQDFPRLSSILARDRFMPRQFTNRGDRLVFSNGVVVLATLAALLVVIFKADLNKLIQLYVVGVFTSFTLSQTGMVRRWLRLRDRGEAPRGWRRSLTINAIGATTTGAVLVVVTATKFVHGAWIVIAAIPFIVAMFMAIHKHYESVMAQLREVEVGAGAVGVNHVVLVVRDLDAATAEAIGYVRSFRPQSFRAVYLTTEPVPPNLKDAWRALVGSGVPDLEPLPARHGAMLAAVRGYVSQIARQQDDFITVIVPETIRSGLFGYLLRNRQLVQLKAGLLREPNVVVADVPVVVVEERPVGVDARPLIPQRTVVLVFVSAVHAPTVRAVNYARSLGAAETRAVYFDLDPDSVHRMEQQWFDIGIGIPLDIVETPFRDLTGPMLDEVRRYTARTDTLVSVVIPELLVTKWRHLLLHNQNALFVKRLLLFEERTVLSSVPFVLQSAETSVEV